jgi:heavy metal sensor kinase
MKRMTFPLRARITALYFAVLAITFFLLATIVDYGFRHSIEKTVNDSSDANLENLHSVMSHVNSETAVEIKNELSELSGLWAGGGLLQVKEGSAIIFQSPAFAQPGKELPRPPTTSVSFFTTNLDKVQYRIASSTLQVGDRTFVLRAAVPTEPFDQALDRFRLMLKETLPALIVLASFIGYWLSGRVLHPVSEIIRASRGIGAKNLSIRLPLPKAHDELRLLTETLNEMLARIEASVQRITQFTADASHDLRTPLALIRCNSELALRRSRSEEEYRKALTQNLVTSVETTCLVENLLTLARADAGVSGLEFRRIDLAQSLQKATEETSILAADKNIRVSAQIPSVPVWVNADDFALSRVFRIVLENAVKYTPRGGGIAVATNWDGGAAAEIEIRDSGIGIPEKDLPYIFERFYRVDQARTRESGGAGLGLAIARTFVDLHGGSINAESKLGLGTAILIRLPVAKTS